MFCFFVFCLIIISLTNRKKESSIAEKYSIKKKKHRENNHSTSLKYIKKEWWKIKALVKVLLSASEILMQRFCQDRCECLNNSDMKCETAVFHQATGDIVLYVTLQTFTWQTIMQSEVETFLRYINSRMSKSDFDDFQKSNQ